MAELKPCAQCHRHIAITEAACPFCDASVVLAPSPPLRLGGRMSRAAVFAAGAALATTAGCGGKKKPTQQQQQQQTAPADAAVQNDPEPDRRNNEAMPYGAPPARRRLV